MIVAMTAAALALALTAARGRPRLRRPVPVLDSALDSSEAALARADRARRVRRHPTRRRAERLRANVRDRRPVTIQPGDVADWCEQLARQVRSGSTLHASITAVRPLSDELAGRLEPLHHDLARGLTLVEAAGAGPHAFVAIGDPPRARHRPRREDRHVRLALDVIGVCASVGGPCAAALDRTAAALRQRAADRSERRSQASQARLSAHVLTVVPLALLGLLLAIDDDVRGVVVTPTGVGVIGGGLVLNGAGWLWMRAVVERTTR